MIFRNDLLDAYKGLQFVEKSHEYSKDTINFVPVSNIIGKFYEPFDAEKWASIIARRRKIKKEEVLRQWDEEKEKSIIIGKETHSFGEYYVNNLFFNGCFNITSDTGYKKALVKFWNELSSNYIPEVTELMMYSVIIRIAGTTDFLLLNLITKKLIVCDYKTNKDLYKNYKGKVMIYPYHYLLDCPFNHYQLQLSYYQLLLEEKGFEIEERWIIWLHDNGEYEIIKAHDFTDIIKTTL